MLKTSDSFTDADVDSNTDEMKSKIQSFISERVKSLFINNFFTVGQMFKKQLIGTDMERVKQLQLLFAFSYIRLAGQSAVNRMLFGVSVNISDAKVEEIFNRCRISHIELNSVPPNPKKSATNDLFFPYLDILKEINSHLEMDHCKMLEDFDRQEGNLYLTNPKTSLNNTSHFVDSCLQVYTTLGVTLLLRAMSESYSQESIAEVFGMIYTKSKNKQVIIVNTQLDVFKNTNPLYDPSKATIDTGDVFTRVNNEEMDNFCSFTTLINKCDVDNKKIIDDKAIEGLSFLSKRYSIFTKDVRMVIPKPVVN